MVFNGTDQDNSQNGRKYFKSYTLRKTLSRIYKELLQLNNKRQSNSNICRYNIWLQAASGSTNAQRACEKMHNITGH